MTQPLYQDHFDWECIQSEKDQIDFYANIVEEYRQDYDIYFKIHPRDTAEYPFLKEVIVLDKKIPMEVYFLLYPLHFDIGITHSSSALQFLDQVKEKRIIKKTETYYA